MDAAQQWWQYGKWQERSSGIWCDVMWKSASIRCSLMKLL
jgi:hypothetical protein